MARAKSGGGGLGALVLIVIAALIAAVEWAMNNLLIVGSVVAAIVALIALGVANEGRKERERIARLREKYRDDRVVKKILDAMIWEGQTSEQLRDSLGLPVAVDRQVLKTKVKETWKYHERRKGQYALRIQLVNAEVVGWDSRD